MRILMIAPTFLVVHRQRFNDRANILMALRHSHSGARLVLNSRLILGCAPSAVTVQVE